MDRVELHFLCKRVKYAMRQCTFSIPLILHWRWQRQDVLHHLFCNPSHWPTYHMNTRKTERSNNIRTQCLKITPKSLNFTNDERNELRLCSNWMYLIIFPKINIYVTFTLLVCAKVNFLKKICNAKKCNFFGHENSYDTFWTSCKRRRASSRHSFICDAI